MYSSRIFLVTLLLCSIVQAAQECLYKGKKVDIYSSADRDQFDGEVQCEQDSQGGDKLKKKLVYKKGRKTEEIGESKKQKYHSRFYEGHQNEWRHGEQLEYYPGTKQIKRRENYNKMHKVGVQESFYLSGKLEERNFYVQEKPERAGSEAAGIGFYENGEIRFIRCSKVKEHTVDPQLCGFMGKSVVNRTDGQGKVKAVLTFLKGEVMEQENDNASSSSSGYLTALQRGTHEKPPAVKTKKENHGDQQKIITYFANGKVKRESWINAAGKYTGTDSEYFESGKILRKTTFEDGVPVKSECYWENGKLRAQITRKSEGQYAAEFTWDTGVVELAGQFSIERSLYGYDDPELEVMITGQAHRYSFRREGPIEVKTREGKWVESGTFKKGSPVGWYKIYDKDGVIAREELHTEGTKDRPSYVQTVKFYENGKLVKEESYNSDGSISETVNKVKS